LQDQFILDLDLLLERLFRRLFRFIHRN